MKLLASRALKNVVLNKKGQQTVEFVLMLGAIVSIILAFVVTFHKQLAGSFFTVIGYVLQ